MIYLRRRGFTGANLVANYAQSHGFLEMVRDALTAQHRVARATGPGKVSKGALCVSGAAALVLDSHLIRAVHQGLLMPSTL